MKPLYFAPLNKFSNALFRHFMLIHGADFVFSELIMIDRIDNYQKDKLLVSNGDLPKTIFQIGAKNKEEVIKGVNLIKQTHTDVVEINLNAGCPQSSMQNNAVCGGLLLDRDVFFEVSNTLAVECKKQNIVASVKLRVGTSPENILIKDFLDLLKRAGIKKVYIHARPLKYNYTRPAIYDYFKDLKKDFPSLELIFNGDVDSYSRYRFLVDLGADGVMIGRAALANQDIFSQIKNEQVVKRDFYDPFVNDPNITFPNGFAKANDLKKKTLIEFILLSKECNISLSLIKTHLLHATKGLGARTVLSSLIRDAVDFSSLKDIVDNL